MFDSVLSGETIAVRYERRGGVTTGFDHLRILLAILVVVEHSIVVTDQPLTVWLWTHWPRMLLAPVLPSFFALSGFLVAGSLKRRSSLPAFVAMRVIRLVPALTVEVILSALILGPLLTDVSLRTYFTSPDFWIYFLNIIGEVQYVLPGMFGHNPFPFVMNQSIWTIPYELNSYLWLIGLAFLGFVRNRGRVVAVTLALVLLGTIWMVVRYRPDWQEAPVSGRALVVVFLAGVVLQLYADRVRLNGWLAAGCMALGMLLILDARLSFLAVLPIAYATVYVGMLNPHKSGLLFTGDYSYGLYLFAFPIQQALVHLYPAYNWWGVNAAVTLAVSLCYAALSWWLVERPILSRKQWVSAVADWLAAGVLHRMRLALPVKIGQTRT